MTQATGLGTFLCDLPTAELRAGAVVEFTFFWTATNNWQGANFIVEIAARE
jgi:glucoamylase